MAIQNTTKLTRIGLFYDGNYFLHVSNYYAFNHPRNSRISLRGLHTFIRHQVAKLEDAEPEVCQIVDMHFFRNRISAIDAQQRGNLLYYDRVFEDILMWEGVTIHYLPQRGSAMRREDKSINVRMALEVYELASLKEFDVVVLITSDGDYAPLVRKLNALGTRVMVLSWDFEFDDNEGKHVVTRTSQELLEEVSYPLAMHDIIEKKGASKDKLIQDLFVKRDDTTGPRQGVYSSDSEIDLPELETPRPREVTEERFESFILTLKNGYGFIKYPPNNLFFHASDLLNAEFPELQEGDPVDFNIGYNREGEEVAKNVKLLLDELPEEEEEE
jgi:cold shock CspA family protein